MEIDTVDQKDFGVVGALVTVVEIRYTPQASPTAIQFPWTFIESLRGIQTAGCKPRFSKREKLPCFRKFHNCNNTWIHLGRYVHSNHILEDLLFQNLHKLQEKKIQLKAKLLVVGYRCLQLSEDCFQSGKTAGKHMIDDSHKVQILLASNRETKHRKEIIKCQYQVKANVNLKEKNMSLETSSYQLQTKITLHFCWLLHQHTNRILILGHICHCHLSTSMSLRDHSQENLSTIA